MNVTIIVNSTISYSVHCWYTDGNGCFYHTASVKRNGKQVASHRCQYFNRTWEAYSYQTAMIQAFDKIAKKYPEVPAIVGRLREMGNCPDTIELQTGESH